MNKMGLLTFLICIAIAASQENYAQWGYTRTITVNTTGSGANIGVTQVKFPILIRLNSGNFDFTKAASNGSDVRFTKANGATRLKHQIERWDATSQAAEIWVLMDTVAGNGNTTLKMFFGKSGAADSSNSRAVFDTANQFQAVFHMGEAANDTIRDATANGFKGVPRNRGNSGVGTGSSPTDTLGAIGKAKKFMGNNANNYGGSYHVVTSTGGGTGSGNALNFQNDSSTYQGISQYTLSAWIFADTVPDGMTNIKGIVAKSGGLNARQYHVRLLNPAPDQTSAGPDTNRVEFNDGVPVVYKSGTSRFNIGNWFQVVAVRRGGVGTPDNLKIYGNGGNVYSGSASLTQTLGRSDYDVFIGSFSNDSGYFSGKIDEVTFSNIARDSNWVRLGYQTQRPDQSCVTASALQQQFPSNLTYSANPAIYARGIAIPSNLPAYVGIATHFSVSPALTAGLSLDTNTGIITGNPTAISPASNYTVAATSPAGTTTATLNVLILTPPSNLSYTVNPAIYRVNAAITNNVPSVSGDVTRYSVNPALPTGLTLDTITGVISGTPTVVTAAAEYTVTASNPASSTTRILNITVMAPPSGLFYFVNPATYGIGVAIANDSPSVTGTVTHYSVSPALPSGLRLDSVTGVVSGTPTAASAASDYTVMAANAVGFTTVALNIRVLTPPSNLSYTVNPAIYRVNAAITNNVPSLSGDVTRYSVSPPLPTGLALDTTTGVISGTPTVVMAAANYTITASNPVSSTTRAVNITVLVPPTALSYAVNPAIYGVGLGIASNSPSVTGTVTHYSVNPALPSGLRLDSVTGVVSGTPTVASGAANYTVTAANPVGFTTTTLNIRVLTPPSGLAYPVNPAIYGVNAAITNNIPSVSGDVTRYSVSPPLPTGLALDTITGVISGTPTVVRAAANYIVTASNPVSSTTRAVNITVLAPPTALAYAVNPAIYGVGLGIASNSPSVTGTATHFSVSPALPSGLRLDSVTGVVSGTPTVASGAANYLVTAANVAGSVTTGLNITTMLVPSGLSYRLNSPEYAHGVPIVPDTPMVTGLISRYSVAPDLPAGLTMDTLTGIITGTPSVETPTASWVVTAANAVGSTQVTLQITVTIAPPSNLRYSADTAVYGVNVAIANNIAAVTGTTTRFTVSPPLPAGLRLDSISGIISGTPATGSITTNYNVTVSNLAGSARDSLTFTVLNPIATFAYTTRTLTLGKSVAMTPDSAVVTGTAPFTPITYSVNPSLPGGLTLDSATGVVSGIPANAQALATYAVTAHSLIAQFNKADTLRITVLNPPTGLSYPANPVTYGVNVPIVNDSPTVTGTGVTYSITHPLPTGLSLNASTGVISGTPTAAQTAAYDTVVATNVAGSTNAVLSITVLNLITAFTYSTHTLVLGKNAAMTPDSALVSGTSPFTPVTYSASPILPAGLSLNSSTGIVSGTPTAAQASANYVITASNGIPQFNRTDTLHITVLNPPSGLSYSANPATYGVNVPIVNDSPTVTGTGVTYSVTHPLPAGLALNASTGVISGIPTAAQTASNDTVVATNVAGSTATVLSISVLNPIATFIYPAHTLVLGKNVAMTPDTALVTGTTPFSPIHYSASPTLPAGLALNSSTGIVSGSPTTAQASANYVITASNGVSQFNRTDTLHITVLNPPSGLSYSANPATYGVNVPIVSNNPTVTGTGVTYSVTHPLPAGLALNASTGVISGTPTAAQTASNDTVVATNVAGSTTAILSFTVLPPPTSLTYSANPVIYGVNVPIVNNNPTITGTGVTYSVTHPLPAGLLLNASTGVISGTPTAAQTAANDTVVATNVAGSTTTVLLITVLTPPSGLSYSANPATYGVNVPIVSNNPTVTGTGVTYSVTHPLPAGLALNASTGVISGTPTTAQAAANDTVIATNIAGSTTTVLSITVLIPPSGLSYSANPVTYGLNIPIVNDSPIVTGTGVTYSVTHPLPAGLSLNVSTGVISGTPTTAQAAANDTVIATNIAGSTSAALSITVLNPMATFTYSTHALVLGRNVAMTPDTALVTGNAPFAPITYSAAPALPAGLSLNTSTGIVLGTPTTAQTMAGYVITAHSRIEQFNKADTLRITVLDTPANLSYATNPAVYGVNIAIANNVPAVAGTVARYSISPAPPSGLFFDTVTGVISGTPATASYTAYYTVTAYNIAGSSTAVLSIRVLAPPANFSYNDDPTTYVLGVPASTNIPTVTGFISRFSANPALPPGLVLDSISGLISGTPTTRQSFATDYVITAANIAGSIQTTLNITIVGAPINLSYADDAPTYGMGAPIAPADIPTVRGIVTQYSIDPALPAGIFFDGTTGYILGTPTALSASTLYTITGSNPGGSTQATITLGVVLPP